MKKTEAVALAKKAGATLTFSGACITGLKRGSSTTKLSIQLGDKKAKNKLLSNLEVREYTAEEKAKINKTKRSMLVRVREQIENCTYLLDFTTLSPEEGKEVERVKAKFYELKEELLKL